MRQICVQVLAISLEDLSNSAHLWTTEKVVESESAIFTISKQFHLAFRYHNSLATLGVWQDLRWRALKTASQVALVVKNLPADEGDVRDSGSIPGSGRSLGGGKGNPLQYSCLENPMDRGTQRATVHRVAKSQTPLKQLSTDACLVNSDHVFVAIVNNVNKFRGWSQVEVGSPNTDL